MPTIIDNGAERVVTDQQYQAIKQAAVRRESAALRVADESTKTICLYDQVDGTPFVCDRQQAVEWFLEKDVAKCSACPYSSPKNRDVAEHVKRAMDSAAAHKGASLVDVVIDGETRHKCTGCGNTFRVMKGRHHLETVLAYGPAHIDASVLRIKQYALQPPEPTERPAQIPVAAASEGPEATGERSRRRRHRSRGRGGKGK